jgi:hypothetical protein
MSFGFSVGDFTAIELVNRVCSRFVDALDQFRAISNEQVILIAWIQGAYSCGSVKNLSSVLRDIDDVLPQRKTEPKNIAGGCKDVLKELEDTLDRYQVLDPNTKGVRGRSKRVRRIV